jgi:hypothetical protein
VFFKQHAGFVAQGDRPVLVPTAPTVRSTHRGFHCLDAIHSH